MNLNGHNSIPHSSFFFFFLKAEICSRGAGRERAEEEREAATGKGEERAEGEAGA